MLAVTKQMNEVTAKQQKVLSTSELAEEASINCQIKDLKKKIKLLKTNEKYIQEFKEFKECITQAIATLKQNQTELLQGKNTITQIKIQWKASILE